MQCGSIEGTPSTIKNGHSPTGAKAKLRNSQGLDTSSANCCQHFPFSEIQLSQPSLEASTDISSEGDSMVPADRMYETNYYFQSQDKSIFHDQSQYGSENDHTDTDCMADRVVRFFCPFDEAVCQAPSHRLQWKSGKMDGHISQDCGADWPAQMCLPKEWEESPERPSVHHKVKIQNRCCAIEENERKAQHFNELRHHWHSRADNNIPLRSVRSLQRDPHGKTRAPINRGQSMAYYDSDPEIFISIPKYKRFRPKPLLLDQEYGDNLDSDTCVECPKVPRHSSYKSASFFESPTSVTGSFEFKENHEMRKYVQAGRCNFC